MEIAADLIGNNCSRSGRPIEIIREWPLRYFAPSRSSGERIEVMRYLKVVLFGEIAFSGPRRALSQRVTILQTALLC